MIIPVWNWQCDIVIKYGVCGRKVLCYYTTEQILHSVRTPLNEIVHSAIAPLNEALYLNNFRKYPAAQMGIMSGVIYCIYATLLCEKGAHYGIDFTECDCVFLRPWMRPC